MKLSTRAALLALALCGAMLAAASAHSQHHVPGHPHTHPHAAAPAHKTQSSIRKLGRTLLAAPSTPQVTSGTPKPESAKAAKSTSTVQKVLQWGWNSWGGGYDSHNHGGWGGAVSQPPPGAPVYYPPTYAPHGDHYDYIPGHYHNGRKLMTDGEEKAKTPAAHPQPSAAEKKPAANPAAKPDTTTVTVPAAPAVTPKGATKAVQKSEPAKQTESAQKADKSDHSRHGGWGGHSHGHYDYHAPAFVPHGNHYDYVPGHYHYHEGNHGHGGWGWGKH